MEELTLARSQGLELRNIWNRCLAIEGNRPDLRVVRRRGGWLSDSFAAAAHRLI
jgi:hypothetical protein